MAIRGLTDSRTSFPQIGKLRKGGKKRKNAAGKEIQGEDLTYFRFDSQDAKAIEDFDAAYRANGKEPTEINVFFAYPTTDENFLTCKEEYDFGGLKHRCDGEHVSVLRQGKIYQRDMMPRPTCPGGCKEVGRLLCIIPELKRFAYVSMETHSKNDIVNIHGQLKAVETTFGRLNAIPFVLRRKPEMISTPYGKDDSRSRVEKWMLSIEIDPYWAEKQMEATRIAASLQAGRSSYLIQGSAPATYSLPEVHPRLDRSRQLPEYSSDFKQSETWIKFTEAIARAETEETIDKMERAIYQRMMDGVLPQHARTAIEREILFAREKLDQLVVMPAIAAEVVTEEEW